MNATMAWFGRAALKTRDTMRRRRTRIVLEDLSDEILRDIGIEPANVRRWKGMPLIRP
ncbi:DUF1127 domain-containing protein [Chelativorans intermedius]|nr:DUF1127 domain-containing protein [Chelativorans intermedius]